MQTSSNVAYVETPVDLEDLRNSDPRTGVDMEWRDFILRICRDHWEDERIAKMERDLLAERVLRSFLGQVLLDEGQDGTLEEIALEEGEIYVSVPLLASFMRSLMKDSQMSNTLFEYEAEADGDVSESAKARLANAVGEKYAKKFFTPHFEQQDILDAFAHGTFIWRLRFDPDSGPDAEEVEETRNEEVTKPAERVCRGCGYQEEAPGEDESDEASVATGAGCPECGQPLERLEEVRSLVASEKPLSRVKLGDIELERWSGFEFVYNSNAKEKKDVVWVRRDKVYDAAYAKHRWPHARLNDGRGTSDRSEYQHLLRQRSIQRAVPGSSTGYTWQGRRALLGRQDVIISEEYLASYKYEEYIAESDVIIGAIQDDPDSGVVILKAGERMGDRYPDGICLYRCGNEIIACEPANIQTDLFIGQYQVLTETMHGKSVADALDLQETINDFASAVVTFVMEQGSPTMFYDESVIPDGIGLGGRPSLKIPMGKLPINVKAQDLVYIVPPGSLSQWVAIMMKYLEEKLQAVLGAYSAAGSGLPDAAGNTLGGMVQAERVAQSIQGLFFANRGHLKSEVLQQTLVLFDKHIHDERAVKLAGPYGLGQVKRLKAGDLGRNIRVRVVRDSYLPQDDSQKQQNYMNALQARQMVMTTYQTTRIPLAEERALRETFKTDFAANRAQIASEVAKEILDGSIDFLVRATAFTENMKNAIDPTNPAVDPEREIMENVDMLSHEELAALASAENALQQAMIQQATQGIAAGVPMQQLAPSILSPTDPDAAIIEASFILFPIRPLLDECALMADYLCEWGMTSQARQAPDVVQRAVSERARRYYQQAQDDMALRGAQQMMANPQNALDSGPQDALQAELDRGLVSRAVNASARKGMVGASSGGSNQGLKPISNPSTQQTPTASP